MFKTVAIKDLNTKLYVRKELNQDHILYLAELLQGGVKLTPIQITPDNVVIDGRHRIEAYELSDLTDIRCEVVTVKDETDLICRAYRANTGGPKPPTTEDTEHAVMLLLDRGVAQKDIAAMLQVPTSMARKYIGQIKSKVNRTRLLDAAKDVTDHGLTVPKAAEKHGIDVEKIREVLSARRVKHKPGIAETQRTLTKRYKSISLRNASVLKKMLEKLEDGDITVKQVMSIFDHLDSLQRQSARSVSDWKKRFEALTTKVAKSA